MGYFKGRDVPYLFFENPNIKLREFVQLSYISLIRVEEMTFAINILELVSTSSSRQLTIGAPKKIIILIKSKIKQHMSIGLDFSIKE